MWIKWKIIALQIKWKAFYKVVFAYCNFGWLITLSSTNVNPLRRSWLLWENNNSLALAQTRQTRPLQLLTGKFCFKCWAEIYPITWTKASGRDSKTIKSTPNGHDIFSRISPSATWVKEQASETGLHVFYKIKLAWNSTLKTPLSLPLFSSKYDQWVLPCWQVHELSLQGWKSVKGSHRWDSEKRISAKNDFRNRDMVHWEHYTWQTLHFTKYLE